MRVLVSFHGGKLNICSRVNNIFTQTRKLVFFRKTKGRALLAPQFFLKKILQMLLYQNVCFKL